MIDFSGEVLIESKIEQGILAAGMAERGDGLIMVRG
jgi:hypothetical protein